MCSGAPLPDTSAGAASGCGRMAMGLRTLCTPSDHMSAPNVYRASGAPVRVKRTSYVRLEPAAIVNVLRRHHTLTPARRLHGDGVMGLMGAYIGDRAVDRLLADEVADRDRGIVEIARIDRRRPVGNSACPVPQTNASQSSKLRVVDKARIQCGSRLHQARAYAERTRPLAFCLAPRESAAHRCATEWPWSSARI